MRLLSLAAVAAALVLAGCGGSPSTAPAPTTAPGGNADAAPAAEPPDATRTARSDVGTPPPADPTRERPPALTGTTLDGEPISTADFRGRPLLVVFFAFH